MSVAGKPILITTISAREGGVPAMLRFAIDTLRRNGWDPQLAYYQPYSLSPELSVPLHALGRRRVSARTEAGVGDTRATAIGAWFPEFEFTHYQANANWRRLIESFSAHLVISGTAIAGAALARTGTPFVAWVATDLDGDRRDRVHRFPWYRRALDQGLNVHVLRSCERKVLRSGHTLALSRYTRIELNRAAGASVVRAVLPAPVDTNHFHAGAAARVPGAIGFSGRLDDPRKNLPLLLDAMQTVAQQHPAARLHLIGYRPGSPIDAWVAQRGLADRVVLQPYVPPDQLPGLLAALDVFVVPSHQEGLCIAALEAMACGVPVISTRCGGPEDFVIHHRNGMLIGSTPSELAAAIHHLLSQPAVRHQYGAEARRTIETDYSIARAEAVLMQAVNQTFPSSDRRPCA